MADRLMVNEDCAIDQAELDWKFAPSGGPGGQHANRSSTRAEVTFDAASSPSLTEPQRARIVERFGPVVRVVADDERSQLRNRGLALERLGLRLAAALVVQPPRRPTRPGRGARERRLTDKREQASRKAERRWKPDA